MPVPGLIIDRLLWGVIGALAAFLLVTQIFELRDGYPLNRIWLAITILLLCLCTAGFVLRWGPIVPCMFLGMVVFSLMTDPIASSHEEAVFKDLGVPLIGAIVVRILALLSSLSVLVRRHAVGTNLNSPQTLTTPNTEHPQSPFGIAFLLSRSGLA